jgi:membrane dipeptidase
MVIDLHNDLLSYLSVKEGRTPYDTLSKSGHGQLAEGRVKLQVMAIWTITSLTSVKEGATQVAWFQKLLNEHPEAFSRDGRGSSVQILPAFENGSGFAAEDEPFEAAIARLESHISAIGSPLYISMTWNDENRFGGGNNTKVGLKPDGKRLLEWMDGKQIGIDFSHTSDTLAHDILTFIDARKLTIPVLASHSNYRSVQNVVRNLPDEIAREIIRRKGVIGLNFFAPFVGAASAFADHIAHSLKLGGEEAICFGADFFHAEDYAQLMSLFPEGPDFFPNFDNSSTYPQLLELLRSSFSLPLLAKLSSQNAANFIASQSRALSPRR